MFDQLVESGSHKEEFERRGWFMGGTLLAMLILFTIATVWSIMHATAEVDVQNLELIVLIAPISLPQQTKPIVKQETPKAKTYDVSKNVDTRKELVANVDETKLIPEKVGVKASEVPPVRRGVTTILSSENSNTVAPMAPNSGLGTSISKVEIKDEPPPPKPTPKPTPRPAISGGVMNGKAVRLTQPSYPPIARSAHASGQVVVQVVIDEDGNVIEAHVTSGHPLLQAAAVSAARSSKFTPTLLSGQPTKVNGTIIYNFVYQ